MAKPKAKYATLSEVCEYASSHRSRNIAFNLPESDNVNQESEIENIPGNFTSDDTFFRR